MVHQWRHILVALLFRVLLFFFYVHSMLRSRIVGPIFVVLLSSPATRTRISEDDASLLKIPVRCVCRVGWSVDILGWFVKELFVGPFR